MLDLKQLRAIREEMQNVLKTLTESALVSAFSYSPEMPTNVGQFWEYELNIVYGDNYLQFKCGCFVGSGTNANQNLDIDLFFSNNDRGRRGLFAPGSHRTPQAGPPGALSPAGNDLRRATVGATDSARSPKCCANRFRQSQCRSSWEPRRPCAGQAPPTAYNGIATKI